MLGDVKSSVLSHGVTIGENSNISDSVIMPNVTIGKNVVIEKAMIGEGAVIKDNVIIRECEKINVISEYDIVDEELISEGVM